MYRVEDVAAASRYYVEVLGLRAGWAEDGMAGLVFPESDAELVLHSRPDIPPVDVNYLVDDVPAAVARYVEQGCLVVAAPFSIAIGMCAVIRDPFGVTLTLVDMTTGPRSPIGTDDA